ncbi:protein mono-ADP-ribosyltransferase PARP14-like isoform X3 [Ascaphus truei]
MDCSLGSILIHFNQETVRERVLQKQTHQLNVSHGEILKLDVSMPGAEYPAGSAEPSDQKPPADSQLTQSLRDPDPAAREGTCPEGDPVTQDVPPSVLLIENIQDSCTPEMLHLLLENVSNLCEDRDFHVEMITEICSAVVTFTRDIDISGLIRTFSGSVRVNQLKLTARPLGETKSIRAENLPPNTCEDHVIIYFESPKHGGGGVQEAALVPEEDAAIVTFTDPGVIKTVLEKQHVFGKKPISVYPYYVSLGVSLYGRRGPRITIPKPLEFPMSPYILEFILNDAQLKLNINKKMADYNCEITWPELDCPNPVIKLCISKTVSNHLRTMARIVRTWSDQVSTEFSFVISKYKATEYDVNRSVWEAIKGEVGSSTYDGVLIKPDLAKEKVFLAGFSKDVNKIEQSFRKLVQDITKKMERENQSSTTPVPLSPALYEILCNNGLEKNVLMDFPELKMSYDVSAKNVLLCGLKEEMYGAKCEILNMEQKLNHKTIHLDHHIIQFLGFADSEELSCLLFIRHNINAMFQIEGNSVRLTGYSVKDLSEAEEQIKCEIVCKRINVEEKNIIQKTEWISIKTHLCEVFNPEKCTVLIEEFPTGAENQVVITGLSSPAQDTYQQLNDFLEKNTPIQKDIPVKSVAVTKFIMEERKTLCEEIKNNSVKLVIKQKTIISLQGSRLYVLEAAARIERLLSSLHSDTLRINKPGAKKFCISNEEMYVNTAKNKFNCLIYLQKDGEDVFTAGEMSLGEPRCQINLPDGVVIAVYKDDLIRHCVDVVVNAANEDLKHIGGLALALLQAAGPRLQTDCDRIVREQGTLSAGDSVITHAGNLPCKQVIHTVGPRWDSTSKRKCERLLGKAITTSLELAAENGHRSIGIPAVSSGIFGFPEDLCALIIVETIREYVENQHNSSIKEIHLVGTDDKIVSAFTEALKDEFGDQMFEGSPKSSMKGRADTEKPVGIVETKSRAEGQMVTTKEGLIIKLIQGNIQDAITDVIVNSVGRDLRLDSGGASKALSGKAGQKLQKCLDKVSHKTQVKEGSVYETEGCDLSCRKVIHVVTPQWDKGKGSSEKILRAILRTCLKITEKERLQSVTFPAIGTGNLGFPKAVVADFMFDEILQFSSKKKVQNLQEVNFVLHPSDTEIITEFSNVLSKRIGANPAEISSNKKSSSAAGPVFFGAVTTPALGVHEMKVGSVTYQVKSGDITKENTDVIVNSSNGHFNLKTGVSKAILDAAGAAVEDECAQLASQPHDGYIVTQKGNLLCKHILHVVGVQTPERITECVSGALLACENLQATSVTFPAIGTGAGNASPPAVADAILDAVEDFASSKSAQCVQTVKVVIFQQAMLNDFYLSMKKKEGSSLPVPASFFSKLTSSIINMFSTNTEESTEPTFFELKDNIEPAIFHVCGHSGGSVASTLSWLRDLILKEQDENVISDEWIADCEEQEHQMLSELQRRLQVTISYESLGPTIKVSGLTRDVMKASNEILDMVKKIRDKKTEEREAELCSNIVQWRYRDGTEAVPFDRIPNMELEKAKNGNKSTISVAIKGKQYTVNMELKSAMDNKGNKVELERVPKQEGQALPAHWDQMTDQVKVVPLNPGTPEYTEVQAEFLKTCAMKIIQIERIQNKHLWLNYQIKKQSIDSKNPSNEKQLFHGTDPNAISNVNRNGFNRGYAGKNAAMYGNGTYFAISANYSAHDTYSRPDGKGHKFMYLTRVLTGASCDGKQGMIAPPPKNATDPTDLCDSVTDNTAQPSMYVIFNDIQAYPEYLITFTK